MYLKSTKTTDYAQDVTWFMQRAPRLIEECDGILTDQKTKFHWVYFEKKTEKIERKHE